MQHFIDGFLRIMSEWKISVPVLAGAALLIVGIAFIVPMKKVKEWAKDHLVYIIIGIAIILSASYIVGDLMNAW